MNKELTKAEIGFMGKLLAAISVESFRGLLTKNILNAFTTSHNNTNIKFDLGRSKPDPAVIEYIKEREIILSDKTASKLEGNLKYELITGLQNNESIDQITRRLDNIFNDMMPWQLERIARSEVIDAQNAGRISAYKASDVVEYKMWVAAKGGKEKRVCDLCASLHGQIQPVNKPFVNPNNPAESWQHPICHPNGRCTTVPLTDMPDRTIKVGGQVYDSDEIISKVEIPMTLSKSGDKIKAWIVTFANGYAIQCFEDEDDANYFIETSKKKDKKWFDFNNKTYGEIKPKWDLNKKGTKITFNNDEDDKKVGKIEINTKSLNKDEREIWIKQTAKRKGHYRTIKGKKPKSKTVKVVNTTKEPMPMTPDNVKKVLSLSDLGMKGGVHHQHTRILQLKDNSYAIYKDMDEEPIFGEVSTYDISKILGLDVVPETVSGDFGSGDGTAQRIIEDGKMPVSPTRSPIGCAQAEEKHFDDIAKVFVLDLITGNPDRTAGNTMITDDRVYAIDNEFFGCPGVPGSSLEVLGGLVKEGYFNRNDPVWGDSSPIFGWLALLTYDNPDLYKKLDSLVVKHLTSALDKESKVIDYYSDDKYKDLFMDDGDTEMSNVVEVIKENFIDARKYIDEHEVKT